MGRPFGRVWREELPQCSPMEARPRSLQPVCLQSERERADTQQQSAQRHSTLQVRPAACARGSLSACASVLPETFPVEEDVFLPEGLGLSLSLQLFQLLLLHLYIACVHNPIKILYLAIYDGAQLMKAFFSEQLKKPLCPSMMHHHRIVVHFFSPSAWNAHWLFACITPFLW